MIGSKQTQGEAKKDTGPRRFKNGHKQFTAAEAMELKHVLKVEEQLASNFERNKHKMVRARNPLTGEQTPRGKNDGVPILPDNLPPVRERVKPEVTGKIGFVGENCTNTAQLKDRSRIRTLQHMNDNIAGELEYWQAKVAERERRVHSSLITNRMKPTQSTIGHA